MVLAAANTTNVVLSDHEFFLLFCGAFVPLVGYIFNHFVQGQIENVLIAILPTPSNGVRRTADDADVKKYAEAIKGFIQVVAAAAFGAVYTAVITNAAGNTNLVRGAAQAVVAALFSHNLLWKPSSVNVILNPKNA